MTEGPLPRGGRKAGCASGAFMGADFSALLQPSHINNTNRKRNNNNREEEAKRERRKKKRHHNKHLVSCRVG